MGISGRYGTEKIMPSRRLPTRIFDGDSPASRVFQGRPAGMPTIPGSIQQKCTITARLQS
jgi:hypothetical protein